MVPSHPTIVIGYGQYGRSVLRALLQDGHDRGALEWEDPDASEDPGARRLKNLVLLWTAGSRLEDAGVEGNMARDLYSQIQEVSSDRELSPAGLSPLAEAAVSAKDRLLDASRRSLDSNRLRLGLDVIVLAQPTGAPALGSLEDLLEPVVDALAADRSLEPPGPGDHLLNFVLFLDFDRFWDGGVQAQRLRDEVQSSAARWQKREAEGKPGFAHIYLMDGQVKEGGRRKEVLRIEEVTLLLGFMLFEGQRDHPQLRYLFQRRTEGGGALATFAIRMIERSRELLTRLAAANFASGWLDYLAGHAGANDDGHADLREALAAYGPASLDLAEEKRGLDQTVQGGLLRIDDELADLVVGAEAADWPQRVRTRVGRALLELKSQISAWAGERSGRLSREFLSQFPNRLKAAVSRALYQSSRPLPLGAVIAEIREFDHQLEAAAAPTPRPPEIPQIPDGIDEAHHDFLEFSAGQLKPASMEQWWLLLGIILAAVWAPVAVSAVNEMPMPDPSDWFLLRKAYELLVWLVRPWVTVLLFTAAFWVAGRWWFGSQIAKWVARARAVYINLDQGKLRDVVRRHLRNGPGAHSITAFTGQVYEGMRQRQLSDVRRETARVLERLQTRKLEIEWLHREMREFLRTHGVDPDKRLTTLELARAQKEGYRVFVEWDRDLDRIAQRNPPSPERYESAQSEKRPTALTGEPCAVFEHWGARYCDTFLYPVLFLEQLCKDYADQTSDLLLGHDAESARADMAREVRKFLDEFGQFPLSFDWSSAPGSVADTQSFCVLPRVWRDLPNISSTLSSHAFVDNRVLEGHHPDRCYLLRVQWNASLTRLGRDSREDTEAEAPRI